MKRQLVKRYASTVLQQILPETNSTIHEATKNYDATTNNEVINSVTQINDSTFTRKSFAERLESEGMNREQARMILEVIDEQLENFKSEFYEKYAHPQDYHHVISTLRHSLPHHNPNHHLLYTQNQLKELENQISQNRQELVKVGTDVKANLQLDVSLERKRLDEVEGVLMGRCREGAEYAQGKVEECRAASEELWRRTSTGIATVGASIITLFFIYNSFSK